MKRILRVGEGYALTNHKRKRYTIRYFSLLAVLTSMCLYAVKQASAQQAEPAATAVADTSASVRDTLAIEEVEINAGYYTTTRKTSTGNIVRVNAEDLGKSAAFNPIAALAGRVAGLVVTQSNGIAGSSYHVQLRGHNSITQGSEPLYIVNGVPFATGGEFLNTIGSAAGQLAPDGNQHASGLSPFNLINVTDIESIEVLKDADALAIYGSRGANGVILITTKSGKGSVTKWDMNIKQGVGYAPYRFRMLNTQEYVAMRREALANDGVTPSNNAADAGYAPDIMLWDTTRYTDLQRLLTGGTAAFTNIQLGVSGGKEQTHFRINGGYNRQKGVLSGNGFNTLGSLNSQFTHKSSNGNLTLTLTSNLSQSINQSTAADLSMFLMLPPNLPTLRDREGKLVWQENGYAFDNPLAYTERSYRAESEGSQHRLTLNYRLWEGLVFNAGLGYNTSKTEERAVIPQAALDPAKNLNSTLRLANSASNGWIVEPQLNYDHRWQGLRLDALVGATWQQSQRSNRFMRGEGFADDLLIEAIEAAQRITVSNNAERYRYNAVFGRIMLNHADKYLINLSARRDGSSRFGPGRRYANFGAIGAAWVLSEEQFLRNSRYITFAKIRGSYGVTGNDQIRNYQYLDAWEPTNYPYLGQHGISPVRLFNPDYAWEENRKLEAAVEIGAFKNLVYFTVAFYRNRSDNQLINFRLPTTTGFQSMLRNFDAEVQNKGWEFSLETPGLRLADISWDIGFNVAFTRNKLLKFDGLDNSSYANSLAIGYPLSVTRGYVWQGVDSQSGAYVFEDIDGNGRVSGRGDYRIIGHGDPKFTGGMSHSITYRGFSMNILFEFRNQKGRSYMADTDLMMPGLAYNQPALVLDRWQPGTTHASVQRFAATPGTDAYSAFPLFRASSAAFVDASYIRCRNFGVSYEVPTVAIPYIERINVLFQSDNLFTISNYKGGDPETQRMFVVPPIRSFQLGLNLQF